MARSACLGSFPVVFASLHAVCFHPLPCLRGFGAWRLCLFRKCSEHVLIRCRIMSPAPPSHDWKSSLSSFKAAVCDPMTTRRARNKGARFGKGILCIVRERAGMLTRGSWVCLLFRGRYCSLVMFILPSYTHSLER